MNYMKTTPKSLLAGIGITLLATGASQAHVSYTGRNFGTFTGGILTSSISNQAVGGNFGWADGTDADFGDSHRMRAFRFTLNVEASITLTVSGIQNGTNGANILGLTPGFSIYSGLAHLAPISTAPGGSADHDTSAISVNYLASLGGTHEGAFNSLATWRMGGDNQPGPTFNYDAPDGLSTFTYVGHAVDGTAANYGNAAGIVGDGVLDGTVTGTFNNLAPGNYSVFIGGADYSSQSPTFPNYGISANFTAVPEPVTGVLGLLGSALLLRRRRS